MIDYSRRVQVFYNLHKKTFSVRQNGIVVQHSDSLDLYAVAFRVQPAGREKVLREKRKNVHAFVTGRLVPPGGPALDLAFSARVMYNPYKAATFVNVDTQEPVYAASYVALRNSGKPSIIAGGTVE